MTISTTKRLIEAREAVQKSMEEMAEALGITFESYRDLEDYEDEIINGLIIEEVFKLSTVLKTDVRLWFADPPFPLLLINSASSFANMIRDYVKKTGISIAEFEESAGWQIEECLNDPSKFLQLNLDAIMDICNQLGVNWLAVLPSLQSAR